MICPHCYADDSNNLHRVIKTVDCGNTVLRYRRCWNCNKEFEASERYATEWSRREEKRKKRQRANVTTSLVPIIHSLSTFSTKDIDDEDKKILTKAVNLLKSIAYSNR